MKISARFVDFEIALVNDKIRVSFFDTLYNERATGEYLWSKIWRWSKIKEKHIAHVSFQGESLEYPISVPEDVYCREFTKEQMFEYLVETGAIIL